MSSEQVVRHYWSGRRSRSRLASVMPPVPCVQVLIDFTRKLLEGLEEVVAGIKRGEFDLQ